MNKKWIGFAALAVAVLALTLVAAPRAFAQEPDPTTPAPYGYARGGFGYGGYGMMGGGMMANTAYAEQMHTALAESLGLTLDEFDAEIAAGKTLWQIADEQGVSYEDIAAAKLGARAAMLAQAVEDGVVTQEQATWMLERMQYRFQAAPDAGFGPQQGFGPGMMGRGARGRGGMMGGFGGAYGACPYATGTADS